MNEIRNEIIYEDMINEDDTNEIVLIKISQYCLRNENASYKDILALYKDYNNEDKAIGYSYTDHSILSIDDIISIKSCALTFLSTTNAKSLSDFW